MHSIVDIPWVQIWQLGWHGCVYKVSEIQLGECGLRIQTRTPVFLNNSALMISPHMLIIHIIILTASNHACDISTELDTIKHRARTAS